MSYSNDNPELNRLLGALKLAELARNSNLMSGSASFLWDALNGDSSDASKQLSTVFGSALSSLNLGLSGDESFANFLHTYMGSEDARSTERNDMFYQAILQRIFNQEQREYDESRLSESRNYNLPLNELARLQAAGLSRGEAISVLGASNGGSVGGNTVGSMGISAPGVSAPSGSVDLAERQYQLAKAMGVAQGVEMLLKSVGTLVDTGMDANLALENAKMISSQNFLTQQQLHSLNQVNEITRWINDSLINGTLEQSEVDKWQNANDVFKYLNQNKNREDVKPVFSSGAVSGVFGSTYGTQMFNQHWHEEHDKRSFGEQFRESLNQTRLRSAIMEQDKNKSFVDVEQAWANLRKTNAEVAALDQAFSRGEIEIEIANQRLKVAEYEGLVAETESNIYNDVMNVTGAEFRKTGSQMMSAYTWTNLWEMLEEQSVNHIDPSEWEQFLLDNRDAAFGAARVIALMKNQQILNLTNENGDPSWWSSLASTYDMLRMCGIDRLISFGGDAAVRFGLRSKGFSGFFNRPGQ